MSRPNASPTSGRGHPRGGTFHPKLYLFKNVGRNCCVIGNSNFTSGGFGDNTELNICIEGSGSDPFFRQVSKFIDKQEKKSDRINKAVFDEYKARYQSSRRARQKFAQFSAGKRAKARAKEKESREAAGQEPPDHLNRSWKEFTKLILAPNRRERVVKDNPDKLSYLQTADRRQQSFAKHGRLAKCRFVTGNSSAARRGKRAGSAA